MENNWKSIDSKNVEICSNAVRQHFADEKINDVLYFLKNSLEKPWIRADYRELIELSILFLGGDEANILKIKPPGAMHHIITELCIFITMTYVKHWLECNSAVKAPNQDLTFLKELKKFESVDKVIAKAALEKFSNHLWYLNEEIAVLGLFDNDVDEVTKNQMVENLRKESSAIYNKRYIPSKEELSLGLYDKNLSDFVSANSKNLFNRLKIDDSFLQVNPSLWEQNEDFVKAKKKVVSLKAVNDTAERGVKLVQDFNGLITANEEQKQFLLRCVQEHRTQYKNCRKDTLKRKYQM